MLGTKKSFLFMIIQKVLVVLKVKRILCSVRDVQYGQAKDLFSVFLLFIEGLTKDAFRWK